MDHPATIRWRRSNSNNMENMNLGASGASDGDAVARVDGEHMLLAARPVVTAVELDASLDDIDEWLAELDGMGVDVSFVDRGILDEQRRVAAELVARGADSRMRVRPAVVEVIRQPFTWKLPKGAFPLGWTTPASFHLDAGHGLAEPRLSDAVAENISRIPSSQYRCMGVRVPASAVERRFAGGRFGLLESLDEQTADALRAQLSFDDQDRLAPLSSLPLWHRCFVADDQEEADRQADRQIAPFLGRVMLSDRLVGWRDSDNEMIELDFAERPVVLRVLGRSECGAWEDTEMIPGWDVVTVPGHEVAVDADGRRWDLSKLHSLLYWAPAVGTAEGFGEGRVLVAVD